MKVVDTALPAGLRPARRHARPPALRRGGAAARAEGHHRRDEDGRGHARRVPRRNLQRRLLPRPPARAAPSRARPTPSRPSATSAPREFHARAYAPRNLVVAAAGNVATSELVELAARAFEGARRRRHERRDEPTATRQRPAAPILVQRKKELEQAHLIIATPFPSARHEDRYAASLLSSVVGGGTSSRLWQRVREERGLAYSVGAVGSHFTDAGIFQIYAGTSPEQLDEVLDISLEEMRRVLARDRGRGRAATRQGSGRLVHPARARIDERARRARSRGRRSSTAAASRPSRSSRASRPSRPKTCSASPPSTSRPRRSPSARSATSTASK